MTSPAVPIKYFNVYPYSQSALEQLLAEASQAAANDGTASGKHSEYLDRYLQKIGAKTIVVERDYIDRDYLEDYAAYYVKCFRPYKKTCARLHFFQVEFSEDDFKSLLAGSTATLKISSLQDSYCGFIVIKPLPQTVIGRTCLRIYDESSTRVYPAARRYSAHLFGIRLSLDKTLPFQEQDNVVAACATSALWSIFQATALEFHHALMTPIEITRAATEQFPADTRMIPNRSGLSSAMMAHAIRSVGLEPLLLAIPHGGEETLCANIYAYLSARIPLIMGIALFDVSDPDEPKVFGFHAVAVAGYNLESASTDYLRNEKFLLKAKRINKFYVHDDQIGPFARMELDGGSIDLPDREGIPREHVSLTTSWINKDGLKGVIRAVPNVLLVPLYHKIRIPYEDVYGSVCDFDALLEIVRVVLGETVLPRIEWDIRIADVNEIKQSLQISGTLDADERLRWLTSSMPRFLWRATGTSGDSQVLDILFDATDIHTSDGIHAIICYDPTIRGLLNAISAEPRAMGISDLPAGSRKFLRWLRDNRPA